MRYRYRKDDELKDSGVEWLGKIDKDCTRVRIGHICDIGRGRVISNEEILDNIGEYPVYSSQTKDNGVMGYINTFDFEGEYVTWTTDGANAGTVFKRSGKFNCTNVCGTLKNRKDNVNLSYLSYALSIETKPFVRLDINPKLMNNEMANIKVCIPNIGKQEKIANFLDEKTSQFDLIISKKEKLIERLEEAKKSLISEVVTGKVKVVKTNDGYELVKRSNEEMKDSGVEWLGDIPKDWDVKRIKQISSVISKGTTPSTVGKEIIDNGEIRFLKAENIFEGKISLTPEFFIDEETNNILKRSELKEHDILFVIAGATIGKVAIVQKEHCPANTNQAISFIRLYDDINYKFVYYWLNSSKLQETMWLYAVQSAQPNLSMENLGNFYIAYPSEDEIYILTDYIEDKGIEISNIINNIKKQIEKLKEAKQSLISEAVTGKIEILD